ncbi:aspartate aminotransferase family protein [Methylotuvimicrobium alcaliphilum]|uniref:Diaminobutyrate--2-oxoglutarate transaminase n=1 Tax=Methylotuvimicrobium alcaliphilum (strain DSM 19304 / NCIMB 14124 / VKM B-2133 / 20Z) TaxID=1091494 RepID=G4T0N1_META2|nr:aspartate aminotransferase family protein [Methylotuvimicrobium alcaliphilum]CCE25633.1 diaminobutyrate--2-oxoglutarate transaminase [Methylotuvimicrobium alcaliphilum 20Z]
MKVFEQWESEIRGYCRVYPTVFKSASNARQVDESGKSYIDFFAGAGVLNFGHNNPLMKKALIDFIEADGVAHSLDTYTTAKRDFIEAFANSVLKPRKMNYKMQFMGPTGTNAVETALKLARKVTGRRSIIAFNHGFHGMTLGSLACTANQYFRNAAGVPLEYVRHEPFGCEKPCIGCQLGCGLETIDQLRAQFSDSSSGLEPPAAFLVEPIQAEGGVNVASREWLHAVQKMAHDLGALLIFDDIQAGCGRTGQYFSFDGMDLEPDIITLAKGIGGFGTPLAMNLVKPEHDQHWQPGEHTGTFRGQGFSFVAGKVALSYFDDDALMNDVKLKGTKMQQHLEDLAERFGQGRFQVRGKGMMQGLDIADGALAKNIVNLCFERGLLLSACGTGGKVIKMIPPLTIPEADLLEGLTIFSGVLADALEAL